MVGKTSLIQRFIENTFKDHNTLPTLSTDFRMKTIKIGEGDPRNSNFVMEDEVKLYVWDTAG